MLRFILDGTPVKEPLGFDQVSEHLYYANDLSAYITEIDGNITFTDDEYDYLRNKFNTDVCSSSTFRIYDDETQEIDFEGLINVADIEFQPNKKWAICEIQNDNITGRIANNQSILCNLTAGKTKNDTEYTVTQQTVTLYDPTGVNFVTREGIRIFDAFKSIVTFMSDGEIGFTSTYFDYDVTFDPQVYSVLMTGEEVRTGNGNSPTISFADLFRDMNSLENLAIAFEDGNIRVENKDYFKQQSSSIAFESVKDLSQYLAVETLYAKVTFGSFEPLGEFDYLQDIRFNGMQAEEYHLGGQCNTDTELNLSLGAIITDANSIQDALPSSGGMGGSDNDQFDKQVMIIHCTETNTAELTVKPASATDFYYNDRFINRNIAIRWLGVIPQSIYAFLGAGNDGCFINLTSDQNNPVPYTEGVQCDQESPLPWNDVNGNYAIATQWYPGFPVEAGSPIGVNLMTAGFYTAPANNLYSFEININVYYTTTGGFTPSMFLQRMTANSPTGAAEVLDDVVMTSTNLGAGYWNIFGGGSFYMDAGDYTGASFIATNPPTKILAGSTFKVSDPLGGVWQTYDASTVYNIENQFQYDIPVEDWKTIKNQPYEAFVLNSFGVGTQGWLKDLSRNLRTGRTDITLLGQNG